MPSKQYSRFSRLNQEPLIYDSNRVVRLGMRDFTVINNIKKQVGFSPWKIPPQYAGRPESIANLFYGSPELWWVLVGYNGFFRPLQDFYVNRVIMIPDPDGVISLLI
jgi:hypothetical protein